MQAPSQDENWLPIESNPEVMNPYAKMIGLNTESYSFQDLLGFEDWAYEMIPKPIIGVIFNFPCKESQKALIAEEQEKIMTKGQEQSKKLFFMQQYAHNACGTIAMIHVIVNALKEQPDLVVAGTPLADFAKNIQGMDSQQAGEAFRQSQALKSAHKQAVVQGQSDLCEDIDRHFISYVVVEGCLYELDGTKHFPVNHGKSSAETFLVDVAKVIKLFFERDPTEVSFSTIVLAKNPEDS